MQRARATVGLSLYHGHKKQEDVLGSAWKWISTPQYLKWLDRFLQPIYPKDSLIPVSQDQGSHVCTFGSVGFGDTPTSHCHQVHGLRISILYIALVCCASDISTFKTACFVAHLSTAVSVLPGTIVLPSCHTSSSFIHSQNNRKVLVRVSLRWFSFFSR